MEKYTPGTYEITIQGSAGLINKVQTELILTLKLMDPCPTAILSNSIESNPFQDVKYLLGAVE